MGVSHTQMKNARCHLGIYRLDAWKFLSFQHLKHGASAGAHKTYFICQTHLVHRSNAIATAVVGRIAVYQDIPLNSGSTAESVVRMTDLAGMLYSAERGGMPEIPSSRKSPPSW